MTGGSGGGGDGGDDGGGGGDGEGGAANDDGAGDYGAARLATMLLAFLMFGACPTCAVSSVSRQAMAADSCIDCGVAKARRNWILHHAAELDPDHARLTADYLSLHVQLVGAWAMPKRAAPKAWLLAAPSDWHW